MSKFKMYKDLHTWIDAGSGVADMIWDSPFQHADYAPYVVAAFLKNVPRKNIPSAVLDMLAHEVDEAVRSNKPISIWKRILG